MVSKVFDLKRIIDTMCNLTMLDYKKRLVGALVQLEIFSLFAFIFIVVVTVRFIFPHATILQSVFLFLTLHVFLSFSQR